MAQARQNGNSDRGRLRESAQEQPERKKVIKFSNVSKRFVLHHERPNSFQGMLTSLFGRRTDALTRRGAAAGPRNETFWALREANFGIYAGEAVGIIGENGSGKSTTLKLVTRILTPTSGTVTVDGRVSALLELGAGFHHDLTGRENVYLNGSLLGFSRKQMDGKLEQIIDFSELRQFIDTPVKHYSSGMYMRLGFAVAISMEPDILITDEVLAVGDEDFQRKCLAKIGDFRRAGKTIIFVSHALEAVRGLCSRAIWIDHGHVREDGPASDVVDKYLHFSNEKQRNRLAEESRHHSGPVPLPSALEGEQEQAQELVVEDRRLGPPPIGSANRWGNQEAQISGVYFIDSKGKQQSLYQTGDEMTIRIAYDAPQQVALPTFGLAIYKLGQVQVNGPNNKFAHAPIPYIHGKGYVDYKIAKLPLLEGHFDVAVSIYDNELINCLDYHDHWYTFDVQPELGGERYGLIQVDAAWQHCTEEAPQTHTKREFDFLIGEFTEPSGVAADFIGPPAASPALNGNGKHDLLQPASNGVATNGTTSHELASAEYAESSSDLLLSGEELAGAQASAEAQSQFDRSLAQDEATANRPHNGIGV